MIKALLAAGRPDLANALAYERELDLPADDALEALGIILFGTEKHSVTSDSLPRETGVVDQMARNIEARLSEVEARQEAIVSLFDAWEQAINDDEPQPIRKLKIAITKYVKACESVLKNVKKPSGLRPGEEKKIDQWLEMHRQTTFGGTKKDAKSLHSTLSEAISTRMVDKQRGFFNYRVADFAKSIRLSLPNLQVLNILPREFKVGKFHVVDDYGTTAIRFEKAWLPVIKKAEKILKSKRLDYICYGTLHLEDAQRRWGVYRHQSDSVGITIGDNRAYRHRDMLGVLIHELGHRLWFKFMDAGQRDTFASPWLDVEQTARLAYESMQEVFEMPLKEREEGWNLAWETNFDYDKFKRWMEKDVGRKVRWRQWLKWVCPTADVCYIDRGGLNRKAFDRARELFDHWREEVEEYRESDPDYSAQQQRTLERRRDRQKKEWLEDKPDYITATITLQDIINAIEPHGSDFRFGSIPYRNELLQALEIEPIAPSVTEYGNTNRREDFAETFEKVVLGQEKNRQVQLRLQRALPKGRVVARTLPSPVDAAPLRP